MSKQDHKRWRKTFNELCLKRDKHCCVFCPENENLDVHHIMPRKDMPNGGYVMENGITLCEKHHWDAETYFRTDGNYVPEGFDPESLYEKIGSSFDLAFSESENLR